MSSSRCVDQVGVGFVDEALDFVVRSAGAAAAAAAWGALVGLVCLLAVAHLGTGG